MEFRSLISENNDRHNILDTASQKITLEMVNRGETIQTKIIELLQSGFAPRLVFFMGQMGLELF